MEIKEIKSSITEAQVEQLTSVFTEAFGQPPSDSFLERLSEKKDLSILLAYEGEKLIGFKIGYMRFKGVFFSWLGAVAVSCRRAGVGRLLANKEATQKCKLRQHATISQC